MSPGSRRPGARPAFIPSSVMAWVGTADDAVDGWFEPYRGRPAVDAAAKIVAGISDHGVIWTLEAAWRARRPGAERRRAIRELGIAGVSSGLVNAGIKSLVGRARPERTALNLRAGQVPVRVPSSSSFPSGHTLAAFCTASVMADRERPVASTARFAIAGLVGLSRLHLRAHHASDVVGGTVIGLALGAAGRLLR